MTVGRHGVASHLDASASYARNGRIIYNYWYFGDGSKATTTVPPVDHVYGAAGSYTAKVVVADSNHTSTQRDRSRRARVFAKLFPAGSAVWYPATGRR